jgi:hypothetical protein
MKNLNSSRGVPWTFLLLQGLLVAGITPSEAQQSRHNIDYLNEKMRVPESELFDEEAYVETGVGLTFGVDRRLSYFAGQYNEAARQFESAIKKYPYKSEIWVYLSRAYYHKKEPGKAQEILKQAAKVMPDLQARFWEPLREGLNREIRKSANTLQLQVDYYSRGQEEYHTLFRLYRFLEDYPAASGVIHAAEAKGRIMRERAGMSSGNNRQAYRAQVEKWKGLGTDLRSEMRELGVAVVGEKPQKEGQEEPEEENVELVEATRLLQLRVNFYQFLIGPDDYQKLFDNYLELKEPDKAAGVIKDLERGIKRLELQAMEAEDYQAELDLQAQIDKLKALGKTMRQPLEGLELDKKGKEGEQ